MGGSRTAPPHHASGVPRPPRSRQADMGAVFLSAKRDPPPYETVRERCPGGRGRGLMKGVRRNAPMSENGQGKRESATTSRTTRTTEWGAPIRKVAQVPQRGARSGETGPPRDRHRRIGEGGRSLWVDIVGIRPPRKGGRLIHVGGMYPAARRAGTGF